MHAAVTLHIDAEPLRVWELVSDITRMGEYSPEVFEAEWLDGATGPAVGARYRGHVKRNEIGPTYWTQCEITECVPGEVFEFAVVIGGKAGQHLALRVRRRRTAAAPTSPSRSGWPTTCSARCGARWAGSSGRTGTAATCSAPSSGSRPPPRRRSLAPHGAERGGDGASPTRRARRSTGIVL